MKIYLTRNNRNIASSVTLVNNMKGSKTWNQLHRTCILKGVFHDASVTKVFQLQQLKAYAVNDIKISFSQDAILPLFLHTCTPSEISCHKAISEPGFSGKCFCSFSLSQAPPCWQTVISGGRLYYHRHWNPGLPQQENSELRLTTETSV